MNKAEDIEQLIYRELPPDRYCYIHNFIVEKDKEIERLNNIINGLEKYIKESIEKHTDDYIDWKYDRNVYLAGLKKLQNVFDKLQELKGSDKE